MSEADYLEDGADYLMDDCDGECDDCPCEDCEEQPEFKRKLRAITLQKIAERSL